MRRLEGTKYKTGEILVRNRKGRLCLIRKCATCGNDFFADLGNIRKGMGVTCSIICARRYCGDKPKEKCICKKCGKEFQEFSSRIKDGRGIYCSKKCSFKGKQKEKIIGHCLYCGKEMDLYPYQVEYDRKYCSKKCAREASRKGEVVRCANPNCGNDFYLPLWEKMSGRRFCSTKCSGEIICGENHHRYKEDKTHREGQEFTNKQKVKILDRYEWKCPVTGKKASDFLLHIHHIIPISLGGTNDPLNGIPLDPEIHKAVHCHKINILKYVRE